MIRAKVTEVALQYSSFACLSFILKNITGVTAYHY